MKSTAPVARSVSVSCSVTTTCTVVARPSGRDGGVGDEVDAAVPVRTASAWLGSVTILYRVREMNSRAMSAGSVRASL